MTTITPKHIRPPLAHPGVLLATWFGAGYLPKAPGTWGSVGALPFAWVLVEIGRSEEHTSELQSHHDLVCRLLLEKKKNK